MFPVLLFSQKNVEKSVTNLQVGLGIWVNNELKLVNKIVIRSEIGLERTWFVGDGIGWHPNFRLEPKYYYNIDKRASKNKKISKNSGSFCGIALNYRPVSNVSVESYSIVPKWGIRRVNNHFNYELGLGLGYRKEIKYGSFLEIDLHLRIGYTF